MKQPKQRPESDKKPAIPMEQAMELSDEEWERLVKDEPREFPKSFYLCQENPEKYADMDV